MKPIAFISYSHKDEEQKKQLLTQLSVLKSECSIEIWSDDLIPPGDDWRKKIFKAIAEAKVAVLLLTANYAESNFIQDEEVPKLLECHRKGDLVIFPIIAKSFQWKRLKWLRSMNVRPKKGEPVWRDDGRYADAELTEIVGEIANYIEQQVINPSDSIKQASDDDDKKPTGIGFPGLNERNDLVEKIFAKPPLAGKYKKKGQIIEGGMGVVVRASLELEESNELREVAIKIILPNVTTAPAFKERFMNEAKILARLKHDYIIDLHDIDKGSIDGVNYFYLVMDYASRGTLADRLNESKSLSYSEASRILKQICEALQYAHNPDNNPERKGIIHRDLKPANILFNTKNDALVADFGIAKMRYDTQHPQFATQGVGTEGYRSPEQSLSGEVDVTSDIYSLGIILYEMLTGKMPETEISKDSMINWEKARESLPEAIISVIDKATQYEPKKRYQTAMELAEAFSSAIIHLPGSQPGYPSAAISRTPAPTNSYLFPKIVESIRDYIAGRTTFWTDDPVLITPRKNIYSPIRLDAAGQKFEPKEAVYRFQEAIIVGEIGSGKSSLIADLVESALKYEDKLSYFPIPINLAEFGPLAVSYDHPLDALLESPFSAKYENIKDGLHAYWDEGRLWLLIDNIDRIGKEDQDRFIQLFQDLHYINIGKQNCIWVTIRPQSFGRYVDKFLKFKQIQVCPPTIPEIWQYLRSWRVKLGELWKQLYDLWVSSSPYMPRQDLFILNLAIKFYTNPQGASLYKALTANYLGELLPRGLKTEENIERVNRRLINMLIKQWERTDRETWQTWEGQIPKNLFEQSWPSEEYSDLRYTVCNSIFSVNETERCISVPHFMLSHWLSEAFLEAKANAKNSMEINEKLAMFMKKDPDFALLCLNRLKGKEWEDAYYSCLIKFTELSTDKEQANGLRLLWKALPQLDSGLKEETADLIKDFPDVDIADAKQLAVDEFARRNREIPQSLTGVLTEGLKTRYQTIKQLKLFEKKAPELDLSHYSVDEWEMLLDILEQYPGDLYVRQVIDVCFDYDTHIDDKIFEKILRAFHSFRKEITQSKENYYRRGNRWIRDISKDPGQVYKRNPFRTNRLLHWMPMAELQDFSTLEMTKKIYQVATANNDAELKKISIRLLPERRSDEITSWLYKILKDEIKADWRLQREIIQKLINLKDINILEKIAKDSLSHLGDFGKRRHAFVSAALFKIYHDEKPANLDTVIQPFMDFRLLKELSELEQISPFIREELARIFVESKNSLTLDQAEVIRSLSENDELIKEVINKLPTKSARNRFLEKSLEVKHG